MRTKFSFITFNFSLGSFGTHHRGKFEYRNTKHETIKENIEARNTKQIALTEK